MTAFYKKLFFILFVCLPVCGFAQISDSLYKALPDSLKPKDRNAPNLFEQYRIISGLASYYSTEYETELKTVVKSLEAGISDTKDTKLKIESNYAIGIFYTYVVDTKKSNEYLKKAIDAVGNSNAYNNQLALSYLSMASNYYILGVNDDSTISCLHNCLLVPSTPKDSLLTSSCYYIYTLIYNRLQLYDKAIYYDHLAEKSYPREQVWTGSYISISIEQAVNYEFYYNKTKNKIYADSCQLLLRNAMTAKSKEAANFYQLCYYYLGVLSFDMGNYQQGRILFDSAALPVYNTSSLIYPNNYYGVKLYKAFCLIKMDNYKEGKKLLDSLTITALQKRQLIYEVLYEYAEKQNDWKAAFEYHRKYKLASDSIDIEGQKGAIFEAEQKYSVSQKEAAIAKLETNSLLQEKQKRTITTIAIIGLLVLIIVVLLLYLNTKALQAKRKGEREVLTDNLHRLEEEMNLHSAQAVAENAAAMANQRKNIGQNMHDEVASSLVALKYYIGDLREKAQAGETRDALENVAQEAWNVYLQTRAFTHGLNNTEAQAQYNVPLFLRSLLLNFNGGGSLLVTTEIDEENINKHFTPLQHNELYRIIKECVANSLKHAGASVININVECKAGQCNFSIKDNGKGGLIAASHGLGHSNMQKRLAILKGTLHISSGINGTEVSGNFPVEASVMIVS